MVDGSILTDGVFSQVRLQATHQLALYFVPFWLNGVFSQDEERAKRVVSA
jgi:hypothetical protein